MVGRWLALLLAVGLLLAGAVQLSGNLYYKAAKLSGGNSDVRRAIAASGVAEQLRQENATAYGARIAALQGNAQTLLQGYTQTLRAAPADPYRWAELVLTLALVGDFGPRFDLAVARAQQLAPHSPAVHLALADVRWRYGGELTASQLVALYPSYVRTMQNYGQREKLLNRIVRARRQPAYCAEYGTQFTKGHWCAEIEARLAACAEPLGLTPRQRSWCRKVDALP